MDGLLAHGQVSKEKMAGLRDARIAKEEQELLMPYAEQLSVFAMQHDLMQRVLTPVQADQPRKTDLPGLALRGVIFSQ
ncbi:MAG: hypothetical protein WA904_10825 [Polaromonas sp.]